ncbi:MAG: fibronectin type III domain-containing protein [Coxiellaceae bacterium]|nr:fibronectin type III domain-containing protein [Coxiellaceae bacterium]
MKKKTLIALSAASTLIAATTIFGQTAGMGSMSPNANPAPTPTETGLLTQISGQLSDLPQSITNGVTAGMSKGFGDLETSLETFLNNMYNNAITWVTTNNHTPNPNISKIASLNSATVPLPTTKESSTQTAVPLSEAVAALAKDKTTNNIQNSLLQFSYSLNQSDSSEPITSAEGTPFGTYLSENNTQSLILGENAEASDTLYLPSGANSSSLTAIDPNNQKLLAPPTNINNNQLDFASVITPMGYTPAQLQNANNFIKYAMLTTKNLLGKVSFSGLYGNAKAIISLKKSDDYQKFMLSIRNMLAIRSISLNVYNQLVAERTPIPSLGAYIGQPTASPLQVEQYRATHDLNNPAWYTALTNEEPATVQRDILITLKEIERQNFEAKLQNERLLTVILASTLQSGSATDTLLEMQQTKLQSAVTAAMQTGAPSKQNSSTAPGSISVAVKNPTSRSANVTWNAVPNATGSITYQVSITGPNNTMVYQTSTQSTQVNVIGLAPNTSYSVTVSPNQGTGGEASFTTTAK